MGIEPTNKGFADLCSDRCILLISNGLEAIQSTLGTILGPNSARGLSTVGSPAALRRVGFVHIVVHPVEPTSVQR